MANVGVGLAAADAASVEFHVVKKEGITVVELRLPLLSFFAASNGNAVVAKFEGLSTF